MAQPTPLGFRDILPQEALARERISTQVRAVFADKGYLPVETPLLEIRSSLEQGGTLKSTPFQLFDRDASLLVLRPDLTLPVARLIAGRVADEQLPIRVRYEAPVVREQASLKGQPRQFTQLGIELVGDDAAKSEREVVELLAETFTALHIPNWRIVFGSVLPMCALLDACAPNDTFREQALNYIHNSDFVALDQLVAAESGLNSAAAQAISKLPRLVGGLEVIDALDALLDSCGVAKSKRGTVELASLAQDLKPLFDEGRVWFDFSIINSFDYYTGIIFKGYSEGIAASIASGGRYDALLKNMGRDNICACGFALSLERLQEVLGEQGESGVVSAGVRTKERRLRIAVPKGSLFKDSVRLLQAAGLPTQELENLGRKLTVVAGDVEYVIVRAQDAPAFVGHGGADCGICGSDSLFEADLDVLQLVDLKFGDCRFVVAEPADADGSAERAYAWRGTMRVATKYPRITRSYFEHIGQQVDIITLHGNIELGPILGMSDRIVDISATGSTLKENNLVVVDEFMECTARFFAGPAAYRCDARVRDLANRLAKVVKEEQ